MGRQNAAMVTEMDIKEMIDENILLIRFELSSYTKRAMTKERLMNLVYLDDTKLSGLASNQLVKWNLIESGFITTLENGNTYAANGGTFSFKVSTQTGFTTTGVPSWITMTPNSATGAGVTTFTLSLSNKTTTGTRSAAITFKETITNKTITITITQNGSGAANSAINLNSSSSDSTICDATGITTYYIESGESFFTATNLYTNLAGTTKAQLGYYKQELGGWRFWNGTAFTFEGMCGF